MSFPSCFTISSFTPVCHRVPPFCLEFCFSFRSRFHRPQAFCSIPSWSPLLSPLLSFFSFPFPSDYRHRTDWKSVRKVPPACRDSRSCVHEIENHLANIPTNPNWVGDCQNERGDRDRQRVFLSPVGRLVRACIYPILTFISHLSYGLHVPYDIRNATR